jgi:hypothetical protein
MGSRERSRAHGPPFQTRPRTSAPAPSSRSWRRQIKVTVLQRRMGKLRAKTSSLLSPSFLPCYGKLETPRKPKHRATLARPQAPRHPRSASTGAPIWPGPPSRRWSGSRRARRCSSGRPHPCSLRWLAQLAPSARRHAAAPPPPVEGAGQDETHRVHHHRCLHFHTRVVISLPPRRSPAAGHKGSRGRSCLRP